MPVNDNSVCTIRRREAAFSCTDLSARRRSTSRPAAVIAASAELKPIVGIKRREERAARRQHPVRRAPQPRTAGHGREQTPHQTEAQEEQCREHAEADDELRLERDAMLGSRQEIALQQVVCGCGVDLDAGKQRVDRRRHHFARAERRGPDEDDLVREGFGFARPARTSPAEIVRKRSLRAAIAQQQVALAIESDGAVAAAGPRVDEQCRVVHVGDADRGRPCAGGHRHRGERERGIHTAVVLDEHRHAPKNAVGIRGRVEESGHTGRIRQALEVTDGAGGVKERLADLLVRRPDDREADGMSHARA